MARVLKKNWQACVTKLCPSCTRSCLRWLDFPVVFCLKRKQICLLQSMNEFDSSATLRCQKKKKKRIKDAFSLLCWHNDSCTSRCASKQKCVWILRSGCCARFLKKLPSCMQGRFGAKFAKRQLFFDTQIFLFRIQKVIFGIHTAVLQGFNVGFCQ